MPVIRQESFAGGELSKSMWARTRHERYKIGARGLKNFIVTPEESAANRPGSELCEADALSQVCIAVGTNVCEKAADGTSWASKTIGTGTWRGIDHSGSMWSVVGGSGAIRVSTDGESWAAPTSVTGTSVTSYTFYSVTYSPVLGRWIAVGAHPYFMTSTDDGDTWVECPALPVGVGGTTWYSAASGKGRLVAVGNTGKTLYSDNGLDWLEGTDTGQQLTSVVYAPFMYGGAGGFSAVSATGTAVHSPDGASWTNVAGLSGAWQEVAASDSMLVAVAPTGTYQSMKSTDGITWVDAGIPGTGYRSICHQGELWVAVGTTCETSPDATAWTSRSITGGHFAVASAYNAAQTPDRRLIPFVFSDAQALVLEFGDEYIRFILDGAYVDSGGSPYELATTYAAADLPRLKYTQMGNIITLTHPSYTPRELERTATAPLTFTLTTIDFDVPPSPLDYSADTQNRLLVRVYPTTPSTSPAGPRWRWTVTAVCKSLDGERTWETKVAAPLFGALHEDDPVWDPGTLYGLWATVQRYYSVDNLWRSYKLIVVTSTGDDPLTNPTIWEPVPPYDFLTGIDLTSEAAMWRWGLRTQTDFIIAGFNLYRGVNNLLGLINFASTDFAGDRLIVGSVSEYNDDGLMDPDYLARPPKGENQFQIYDEDGNIVRTEEPSCVAHHDGRLVFGGTAERPNYLFASKLGDWHNFDQYPLVKADDSILFGLAGRRFEEIRSMVPGRSLLVFTTSGEWAVDGGQPGQPIQPTSLSARERTERGSTWLDALKVGDDHVLFVQRKGTIVRDLAYDGVAKTYQNRSMSFFSQHLFKGKSVVDWCWQEDPWSVVWVVLDDGTLASFSFLPEVGVVAWARHELGEGGFAESICSIPEGEEDAVYLVVRRGAYRGIERFTTRQVTDSEEGVFLDSSLSFTFGTPTTAITGLDHLDGQEVYALADGIKQGPFTVASGAITLTTAASRVHVGCRYDCDFESLDCPPGEGKTRVKSIVRAWVELESSAGAIQAGQTFAKLETWTGNEADRAESEDGLVTGQARINTISSWNHGGRVCIRQSDPLPCTILSVAREVEYGER